MAVVSKHLRNALCSQFTHPWTEGCFKTFIFTWKTGFKESIKIYTTLYMLSCLVTRKKVDYITKRVPIDVLRSSTFLSLNAALFSGFICLIRYLIKFNILSTAFIPGFLASIFSIYIERNSRRQQLTVYMMNIAIQTIFKMLKSRHVIRSLDHGEILLFSIASSGLMFLYTEKRVPDYLKKFFGFLFGHSELGPDSQQIEVVGDVTRKFRENKLKSRFSMCIKKIFLFLHKKLTLPYKSLLCYHIDPCLQYVVYGFHKPFVFGLLVQYSIIILKNSRKIFNSPLNFFGYLFRTGTYNLGLFLGLFSLLFRMCQCSQKHFLKANKQYFALVSGFIAGLANLLYPSINISMYSISKLVELCCRSYLSNNVVLNQYNSVFMILLYSLATASVFHAVILEPHNVPQTYLNFLVRMTNGRIRQIDKSFLQSISVESK